MIKSNQTLFCYFAIFILSQGLLSFSKEELPEIERPLRKSFGVKKLLSYLIEAEDTLLNIDKAIKSNREVISIRGIVEGEYIVNAHFYSKRLWVEMINGESKKFRKRGDTKVKIELHKVNPYTVLWAGEKKFVDRGQEETFLRFRLNKDGTVLKPFTFEKKKYVSPLMHSGGTSAPPPTSAPPYAETDPGLQGF